MLSSHAFIEQCSLVASSVFIFPLKVTIAFANNTAILGSAIYMFQLDACSWYSWKPPFVNKSIFIHWPIWNIE